MKMKSLLLSGCIACLAGITFPAAARGALMYSGVQNIPIPLTGDGVYLRMSDGATTGAFPANWNTEPWLNPFFGGVDFANSDLLRPVITGADQIVNLSSGTVINAAGNFVAGESGSATHVGGAANQFQIGTPGIVGFVFETTVGGPDYFGWLRMTVNNLGAGSIVDWAYESTAGAPVQAGITAVPEPGAFVAGLLCLGAGALRRRRGKCGGDLPAAPHDPSKLRKRLAWTQC